MTKIPSNSLGGAGRAAIVFDSCVRPWRIAIFHLNKTRQGYARERILKQAGYFLAGSPS